MITIVSATRLSSQHFWAKSALGISLNKLAYDKRLNARINYENALPLPIVYNYSIDAANPDDLLVFVHDDVWIDDYYFVDRIIEGLKSFDIIGVAGNKRRLPLQPSWIFKSIHFDQDERVNLSGSVAHGLTPGAGAIISNYGDAPASCELMDGVFFATSQSTLFNHQLRFDSIFKFHFYDLDFCRTAKSKALNIGTWPICLTHQSQGALGGEDWRQQYQLYINKWHE